jgi:hypothetical protein
MAGFVPIAVVPAEGTIVELELQKKSLLKKYFYKNQQRSGTKRKVVVKMRELTAEDVDDLGDFAAYCRTAVRGHRSTRRRSLYD